MNRTIKFRGKRKDNREWIYGSLVILKDGYYILPENSSIHAMGFIEVIPETIGQFTGMSDKNGKEIYEDDLLSGGIWTAYQVKWDYVKSGWDIGLHIQHSFRVIGNIHDNPELLK